MNLALIENFRTLTISNRYQIGDGNQLDQPINIEFVVDEIVLKSVSVYDTDTTDPAGRSKLFSIKCNLINENDGIICVFPLPDQAFHESYHVPFKNSRPINGTYTFSLVDIIEKTEPISPYDIYISFTLLFIKYRK